jgi:hypothetical protein
MHMGLEIFATSVSGAAGAISLQVTQDTHIEAHQILISPLLGLDLLWGEQNRRHRSVGQRPCVTWDHDDG